MHAEIVGDQAVFIDGKPVPAIKVARQGGDIIVLAGGEAGIIGGVENQNGGSVFRLGDDGRSLFVPLYHGRTSQGIAIDAFQFDLRHA